MKTTLKNSSIFRERAIEKYIQRKEQHTILRLISPRVSLFLWVLLLLFFCGVLLVWSVQLPVTISGMGVVIQQPVVIKPQPATNKQAAQETIVLLILPPDQLANLRAGQPVTITAGPANSSFSSTIEHVEAGIMNPTQVRTQFKIPTELAQVISGPSAIATVQVTAGMEAMTYLGSQGQAQVQVGSENALSLLPGFNQLSMTNLTTIFTNIERFFLSLPGYFKTLLGK